MHFNQVTFDQLVSPEGAGKQIAPVFLYLKAENVFLENFEQSPLRLKYC